MPPTNDDVRARAAENVRKLIEEATRRSPVQREGILATESPVVIGAGAGTGKTWTLAWRFVWAIASGRARPRDILTLTFTDKAAQEMRSRIGSLLADVCARPDCRSPLLESALAEIDEAVISTIHAFALRTLRENVLSATFGDMLPEHGGDVPDAPGEETPDPSGGIISQPEEESLWDEMARLIEEGALDELAQGLGEPFRADALALLEEPMKQGVLFDIATPEQLVAFARSLAGLLESRGSTPSDCLALATDEQDVRSAIRRGTEAMQREIRDLWTGVVLPETRPFRRDGDELSDRLRALESQGLADGDDPDAIPRFLVALESGPLSVDMRKGPKALKDCLKELLGDTLAKYRDDLRGIAASARCVLDGFPEEERRIRRPLLALAALCWARRRRAGEVIGRMSFDDMIRLAIPVLEAPSGEARRFTEILVDEFQDTSPLQYRLVMAAAGGREDARIFLVGDVKQSIYRFRHADPRLFEREAARAARGPGRYIPLTTSFRSRSDLIARVNDVFGRLWTSRYEPLDAFSADRPAERDSGRLPVFAIRVTRAEPGEKTSAARLRAARSLARELLRLRSDGTTVWDGKEEALRPCRWSDMAVLVPTRTYYDPLEEIFFPEFGIPTAFLRHTRFFSRSETRDAIAFVRALADPSDDLSLLGFLASPLSGRSRTRGNGEGAWESLAANAHALGAPATTGDPVALMERSRAVLRVKGVSAALELLLEDTAFLHRLPLWRRQAAFANLRQLLDLAREYERSFGPDALGCASYLERSARNALPFEDAASLGEDADVVRVMTVHAAKGLEFPLVSLFDLNGTARGGRPERFRPSTAMGVAFSASPSAGREEPLPLSGAIHSLLESGEEREESARLFYVACTRARDSLLLCSTCGKEPARDSWLSMLAGAGETTPESGETDEKYEAPDSGAAQPGERGVEGPDVAPPPRSGRPLIRLGASAYALLRFCPTAYRMRYRQGMDLDWEIPVEGMERDGAEGNGGADAGTLAHRILERWDFRSESLAALLDPAAPGVPLALRPAFEDASLRERMTTWMETLASSDFGKTLAELSARRELHREAPFRVALENGPLLTGSIDLWYDDGDTLRVVDYKLTRMRNAPPVLYDRQLLFYGAALSRIFPGRTTDLRLYHIVEGVLGAPVRQPSQEDIEADLRDAALVAAEGPFAPADDAPCAMCPFSGSCAEYAFARSRVTGLSSS